VEKLWRGFVQQSEDPAMRLPTFWAICEVGLHGIAVGVESILQGFEHVSKSSGAMKCYEFMGVSLLSSYFFVSNIREDITLVLVAWNMILFFHILGISSSQLTNSYFSEE